MSLFPPPAIQSIYGSALNIVTPYPSQPPPIDSVAVTDGIGGSYFVPLTDIVPEVSFSTISTTQLTASTILLKDNTSNSLLYAQGGQLFLNNAPIGSGSNLTLSNLSVADTISSISTFTEFLSAPQILTSTISFTFDVNLHSGGNTVTIGNGAGNNSQQNYSVAIGYEAGYITQQSNTIAIGRQAGHSNQGDYSIAIGAFAGSDKNDNVAQHDSTIVLNATGDYFMSTAPEGFYVKPIRNAPAATALFYDVGSGEITYNTGGGSVDSNIGFSNVQILDTLSTTSTFTTEISTGQLKVSTILFDDGNTEYNLYSQGNQLYYNNALIGGSVPSNYAFSNLRVMDTLSTTSTFTDFISTNSIQAAILTLQDPDTQATQTLYTSSIVASQTVVQQYPFVDPDTGTQTFTVPAGVTSITAQLWGGGGQGGYSDKGGYGAYIKGTFSVQPTDTLTIVIAQTGQANNTTAFGGGGYNGGAGASWIVKNGTDLLAVAGGAGGSSTDGAGGSAGTTTVSGNDGVGTYSGLGGSSSGGGAGGEGPSTNGGNGGGPITASTPPTTQLGGFNTNDPYNPGGGGAGYYGGGAGGSDDAVPVNGAGGGGSSYVGNGFVLETEIGNTANTDPNPYTSISNYTTGVAEGGLPGQLGGNGLIVFTYTLPPIPAIFSERQYIASTFSKIVYTSSTFTDYISAPTIDSLRINISTIHFSENRVRIRTDGSPNAIAIGYTEAEGQGANAVAVGSFAGSTTQGDNAVAIGNSAGNNSQFNNAIAIGRSAGSELQGEYAISLGYQVGQYNQASNAIALGYQAGNFYQSTSAIAIGYQAGQIYQGDYSIAIGHQAGQNNQAPSTIILNASGEAVPGVSLQEASFYVAPIRYDNTATLSTLFYNTTSKEITYGPSQGGSSVPSNYAFSNLRIEDTLSTTSTFTDFISTNAIFAQYISTYSMTVFGSNTLTVQGNTIMSTIIMTGQISTVGTAPFATDLTLESLTLQNPDTLANQTMYTSTIVEQTIVETFSYTTDTIKSFVVPKDVTSITAQVWGAGGAQFFATDGGGNGAYILGSFPVTPDETLDIIVGQNGAAGRAAYGGGGLNGGGGASWIKRGETVLILAGAGGAGSEDTYNGGSAGVGNSSGLNGGGISNEGQGGSISQGGAGGISDVDLAGQPGGPITVANPTIPSGGLSGFDSSGGGGGAGWFGGGGGGVEGGGSTTGGGGGGSSYTDDSVTVLTQVGGVAAGTTPSFISEPNWTDNVGLGGTSSVSPAGAGFITITYTQQIPAIFSDRQFISSLTSEYVSTTAVYAGAGIVGPFDGSVFDKAKITGLTTSADINTILYYDPNSGELNYNTLGGGTAGIAIGNNAGNTGQLSNAIAIGTNAGSNNQQQFSIAVGTEAGSNAQQQYAVAVGWQAGLDQQYDSAVAIGNQAGKLSQGTNSIGIGFAAGTAYQLSNAIAIGYEAGSGFQKEYSIAIGYQAGFMNQAPSTIILNASGAEVNGVSEQGGSFYVAPIRADSTANLSTLTYNPGTKEITYSPFRMESGTYNGGWSLGQPEPIATISFATPFAVPPIVVANGINADNAKACIVNIHSVSETSFTPLQLLIESGSFVFANCNINWIAYGY